MSESDLASLNLSQLRKLASEHQVNNRSRLAKQELIQALAQVVKKSATAAAKPAAKAKPKAAPKPARKEPEVLDAQAVAGLTQAAPVKAAEAKPKPAPKPKAEAKEAPKSALKSEAQPESKEPASGETSSTAAPEASADAGENADPKRRRRRSRGRGRSRNSDRTEQSEVAGSASTEKTNTEKTGADNAEAPVPAKSDAVKESTPSRSQDRQDRGQDRGQRRDGRDNSRDQNHTPRPPKPRLDNKQLRSVSPILNRLKSLSGGLLELCDPDTPSWAQARLSELLAESGVHPTPCQGQPHPDFHEVLGTVVTDQVADGHIALIEAPGFSLRGDRGDLFSLRKAKVRVAGKTASDTVSESTTEKPALVKEQEKVDAPAQAAVSVPAPASPVSTAAPVAEKPAPEKTVKNVDAQSEAKPDGNAGEAAGKPARESGKQRAPSTKAADSDKESESKSRDSSKSASDKITAATVGPVIDEPVPAAAPHAHRAPKTSQAAALPLIAQPEEELDARGLAEVFGKLGLHKQIQADLKEMGFEQPSPIQEQCIPIALTGSDVIGQAQTGTGKTAAFVLPILHQLYNWTGKGPVALIMCPTRELAKQVHREFIRMAGQSAARAALIYGGVSMDDQFDALATNPHVIIGTPGRLIDHIKRHTLDLSRLKVLVLDEADQMLDIGFLPDIEYVFKHSNPERQCLLFSATMAGEILRITQQYQKDPAHVHVRPEFMTADSVDQKFIAVDRNKKNGLLEHFIDTHNPEQLVVFCKTKAQVDRVALVLQKKKKKAAAIHGDLPQNKRERTLQDFRDGKIHALIATNVAARGLDIPAISHVVNYDIPENPDEYVHRIGRTGRMGASGVARTFITSEDGQFLVEIEKLIGFELEEEQIEGFTASTKKEVKRSIADTPTNTPRLLKPLVGGIRLGRRRR